MFYFILCLLLIFTAWTGVAKAAVDRLEILERHLVAEGAAFGASGAYEKIRGRAWFALDPHAAANAAIADLVLAPRDVRGLLTFGAEFLMLRPAEPARGNGTLLYEVNNRGNIAILAQLDAAPGGNDPSMGWLSNTDRGRFQRVAAACLIFPHNCQIAHKGVGIGQPSRRELGWLAFIFIWFRIRPERVECRRLHTDRGMPA